MPETGLVDFIPPRARRVIEYGCGTGETGEAFRRRQPDCRYIGVDEDAAALKEAAKRLSGTVRASFRTAKPEKADCLVLHGRFLGEGWEKALKSKAEVLPAGAQVILIFDNPGYVPRLLGAIQGVAAAPAGIFLEQAKAALEEAGLAIDRVLHQQGAEIQPLSQLPQAKAMLEAMEALRQAIGARGTWYPWAKQFAILAVKGNLPSRIFVQTIVGEGRVTGRPRIYDPMMFLGTAPGFEHRERESRGGEVAIDLPPEHIPDRMFVRPRIFDVNMKAALLTVDEARERGFLLLHEIDDIPLRWEDAYKKTKFITFAGCHAVQTSTPALAEYLRQYNPEVLMFPNQLKELPAPRHYPKEGPVTIFFGALNREEDWQYILPALNAALEKYGDRVRVKVLFDTKFYQAIQTPHKEMLGQEFPDGYTSYEFYCDVLHSADISLLPLSDTLFNRSKSDLKFIESAGHGAAVLASPTVYRDTVRDGETGFLYRDPREFAERLALLVENRQTRQKLAAAAYRYVKENRLLSQHYEERLAAYRDLFARRAELDRALDARLEKLRQG